MGTPRASARPRQCTWPVGRFAVLGVVLLGVPAAATTTFGVAASSSTSAPSFATTRNYRVGRNPGSVAIGDLNGDRKPDLAVANSEDPSISVLMNRGDGSFRAARKFPTGTELDVSGGVAIGNLTRDSKPDLAVSNVGSNGVIVLTNKGGGTFRVERRFLPHIHPAAVAIADLNGDKMLDLIAVRFGVDAVSVLLNKQEAACSSHAPPIGSTRRSSVLAVCDARSAQGRFFLEGSSAPFQKSSPSMSAPLVRLRSRSRCSRRHRGASCIHPSPGTRLSARRSRGSGARRAST
jgi:hypothetical protein